MQKKNRTAFSRPVFEYHHPWGFTINVVFVIETYDTGSPLIKLINADTGKLYKRVSVYYDERELGSRETQIKNWGDNEGMAKFIAETGIGLLDGSFNDKYLSWYINRDMMDYIDPKNTHSRNIREKKTKSR